MTEQQGLDTCKWSCGIPLLEPLTMLSSVGLFKNMTVDHLLFLYEKARNEEPDKNTRQGDSFLS